MKVLFVMSCYHPVIGGLEKRVQNIAEFLIKVGIEAIILTKKRSPEHTDIENINGVKVIRVEGNVKGVLTKLVQLEKDFDVLILGGQLSNDKVKIFIQTLIVALWLKIIKKKKVVWMPSSSAEFYDRLTGRLKGLCLFLIGTLDKIVCLSSAQKEFLIKSPMVIFDTPWGPPRKGGIQTMSLNIAQQLKKYGLTPVILTRKDVVTLSNDEVINGVLIHRVKSVGIGYFVQKVTFVLNNLTRIKTYFVYGSYEKDFGLTTTIIASMLRLFKKNVVLRLSSELDHTKIC